MTQLGLKISWSQLFPQQVPKFQQKRDIRRNRELNCFQWLSEASRKQLDSIYSGKEDHHPKEARGHENETRVCVSSG